MPLFTVFRRQKQVDLHEFEASLVYRVNARTRSKAIERTSVSKNKNGVGEGG